MGSRFRSNISIGGLAFMVLAAASVLLAACAGSASEAAPPSSITVLNYNILHGLYDEDASAPDYDRFEERLNLLAIELERLRPEVLVLQEVVFDGPADYPDVKAILLAALGGEYEVVFAESGSTLINEGKLGRMTLTRLPVISAANHMIFRGRSAHRTTVQTEGGVIDIYNVHMEGPELLGQQELEVARLLGFIDTKGRNQNPVILAGDFNSRPNDTALLKVRDAGFVDVLTEAKQNVSCEKVGDSGCTRAQYPSLMNNPKNFASIRIDYMFARGGSDIDLRVMESKPFMNAPLKDESGQLIWVSDHIGILTRFEVIPARQATR